MLAMGEVGDSRHRPFSFFSFFPLLLFRFGPELNGGPKYLGSTRVQRESDAFLFFLGHSAREKIRGGCGFKPFSVAALDTMQ